MRADRVVIGAGVIGLAIARAMAMSGREVLVLEAHAAIGMEVSSRSSEVIHAGLYYPPQSVKAETCLEGNRLLYDYCTLKGVPHGRIGKLIVASGSDQVASLEHIRLNAERCGLSDLQWLDQGQLLRKEPAVRAEAALWSPSTGIVDSHALMSALQADLEAAGGIIAFNTPVTSGRPGQHGPLLNTGGQGNCVIETNTVINAAGLHATRMASRIECVSSDSIPGLNPTRGHYFYCAGKSPLNHLVYPLPERGGLGIHGTLDLSGRLRFGPDSEPVDTIDYAFDESRRARFLASIRRWLPGLGPDDLLPGYTGIRPQLAKPGEAFRDFLISGPEQHGVRGLINLFGIESPGLTACLALADRVTATANSLS